jgi:sugar phosphate isomerase/epimerase
MVRLGAPVFDAPEDPRALARAHLDLGYRAAYCPGVAVQDPGRAAEVRQAFEAEDVVIAEVGAWGGAIGEDEGRSREHLELTCQRLALAEEVGARCCVDYIGGWNPEGRHLAHPDNFSEATFELAVETIRTIVDTVNPTHAKFCSEMMQWSLPDSADSCLRLLRAVDRPAYGVHLDPTNLINCPRRYFDTGAVIRDCFEKLGPHIVSCHAKDIRMEDRFFIHMDEVLPGTGRLDYRTYLECLANLPGDTPLMIEHLKTAEEYALARDHILQVGREVGVSFGD